MTDAERAAERRAGWLEAAEYLRLLNYREVTLSSVGREADRRYPPPRVPRVITLSNHYAYRVFNGRWEVLLPNRPWIDNEAWPTQYTVEDHRKVGACWADPWAGAADPGGADG